MNGIKILMCFLLLPLIAGAQTISKYKHKITDEQWIETSWVPFIKKGPKTRGFEVDARMFKKDGQFLLQLRITDQIRTHLVNERNALGFYKGEEKVFVLICSDGMKSREELDFISYPITEDQMRLFLTKKIDLIKMEYEMGFTHDKYSERYQRHLRNCMSMIDNRERVDGKPYVLKDKTTK